MNDEKDRRVTDAIRALRRRGKAVTVTAIARRAQVDRTYIYRRPALLTQIQALAGDHFNEPVTTRLSPPQVALIDRLRGSKPMAQWLREAAIARLAGVDRKYIRRRPGLQALIEALADGDGDRFSEPVTVKLSDQQVTLIDRLRGGEPWARWLREAAMERAARETGLDPGGLDTPGRQAPRRPNYSQRAGKAAT